MLKLEKNQRGDAMDCNRKLSVGLDMHKRYSVCVSIDEEGRKGKPVRVEHDREAVREYLQMLPEGTRMAVETTGNWYWLIDEIEECGHIPMLTHARKAKLMMGQINKTDKLDASGLAVLLHNGTLPTVWIPPGELRDVREICRYRMVLSNIRTKLKNRIHSILSKYAIRIEEVSDIFGLKGRRLLSERMEELPPESKRCVEEELKLMDDVQKQIDGVDKRIDELVEMTPEMELLMTEPGIGKILAAIIWLEIGDIDRFLSSERLASYSGTVPRVHSSGGKTFYGRTRPDVNRTLKWAFVEAANAVVLGQRRNPESHAVRLYNRVKQRKGSAKAVVAVARHLAEASWHILKTKQPYHEPGTRPGRVFSTHEQGRKRHATNERVP